ncbi:hypothetical protein [Kribbella sp. NPDC004536]|uniref:hypothetical protein n=1 Tax=Kribbella sp. NPDC004536 TaxID=3364106 RepID=UPI003686568B
MNSSTPPYARLSRRALLTAAAAVGAAGYLQLPRTPAAAAVVVATPAPRPHNTLLGLL